MALQPGDRFGRYELVSWLGRGGMAETWRARLVGDASVTRPVLIKKVLPEFADDETFVSMFISEARISAMLSHANVAQVFDFGQMERDYFLVMEYVDGQPLHRLLKRAARSGLPQLPIPLATFIALEMCRGLHYAHTRADETGTPLGIVHRDISPDNVLVSYEGQVKIVDFGIAKARSLRNFETEPGVVKGKYLFLSPEQARGEEADARADVWATGLVLYELLCGRQPISGPPHAVMMRMAQGDFPSARGLRKDLPAELDEIVMRALTVDRAWRFESSHAFGDALAGFLYGFAPRFSSMSLACLLQELFREELQREGRVLVVPASFQEELARWRSSSVPPPPAAQSSPDSAHEGALESGLGPAPARSSGLARKLSAVGAVGLLTLGAVAGLHLLHEEPPPAPVDPSPIHPVRASGAAVSTPEGVSQTEAAPAALMERTPEPPPSEAAESPAQGTPPATLSDGAFKLEAQWNVIWVPRRFAGFKYLAPNESHAVTESVSPPRSRRKWPLEPDPLGQPIIFYLLTGDEVSPAMALGEVTGGPLRFRGASHISFFTLGVPSQRKPASRVLQLNSGAARERRVFHSQENTASVERAVLVEGLRREATYSLTLKPVGKGVFLHGPRKGPTRQAACVQSASPGAADAHGGHVPLAFLVKQGAPALVKGVEALKCGFVDDDPSDNQGSALLHVRQTPARGL